MRENVKGYKNPPKEVVGRLFEVKRVDKEGEGKETEARKIVGVTGKFQTSDNTQYLINNGRIKRIKPTKTKSKSKIRRKERRRIEFEKLHKSKSPGI